MRSPNTAPQAPGTPGRAFFLLRRLLRRDTLAPLAVHAAGPVAVALEEGDRLAATLTDEERKALLKQVIDELIHRNALPDGAHESWLTEPLEGFPGGTLTPLLSAYPVKVMRHAARLVEERGGVLLGKVAASEFMSPLVRRWACDALPPAAVRRGPVAGEKRLLERLAAAPFAVDTVAMETRERDAIERAREPLRRLLADVGFPGDAQALAASLVFLAAALAMRRDEAVTAALRLPRPVGTLFLEAARLLSLLLRPSTCDELHDELAQYLSRRRTA